MLLKMLPADKKADFVYFEKIWENEHRNNYFKAKLKVGFKIIFII